MRKVTDNLQITVRWFLLIGVLTGIFFSNGEGIRLFPFPTTPARAEKVSGTFQKELYKTYSLSLHNSAGFSVFQKAKTQKGLKDWVHPDISGNEPHRVTIFFRSFKPKSFKKALFHSSILLTSASERAPPVI